MGLPPASKAKARARASPKAKARATEREPSEHKPELSPEELERQRKEEAERQAVKTVFKYCDLNKNGKIEKNELILILGDLGDASLPDDTIEQIMTAADLDKDGVIDFDEFLKWVWYGGSLQAEIMKVDSEASATAACKLDDLDKQLNEAALEFRTQICARLIQQGADPNRVFRTGADAWYQGDSSTCLFNAIQRFKNMDKTEQEACQEEFVDLVVFLLAKGANPNFSAQSGDWTRVTHDPLINLATKTIQKLGTMDLKRKFLNAFVDSGVVLNRAEHWGKQKEYYGCGSVDYPIFAMVRELEEDGDMSLIELYVESGMNVNCAQSSWSMAEDEEGNLEDWDNHHITLLHAAIEKGHVELVRLLVAKGADVNQNMVFWHVVPRAAVHAKQKSSKKKKKKKQKAGNATESEHSTDAEPGKQEDTGPTCYLTSCLQLAMEMGNDDIIEILRGADAQEEVTARLRGADHSYFWKFVPKCAKIKNYKDGGAGKFKKPPKLESHD